MSVAICFSLQMAAVFTWLAQQMNFGESYKRKQFLTAKTVVRHNVERDLVTLSRFKQYLQIFVTTSNWISVILDFVQGYVSLFMITPYNRSLRRSELFQ